MTVRTKQYAIGLIVLSTGVAALQLLNPVVGDVPLYRQAAQKLLAGETIYGEHPFEYPPYALVWWVFPALTTNSLQGFVRVFGLELLAIDLAIKVFLLRKGRLGPLALFALSGLALQYVYLKRFDLIPAGLAVAAFATLGSPIVSGMCLAAGAGTKLYPIVLAPALLSATRARKAWLIGFVSGLAPLLLLSVVAPWWRFAEEHRTRGLQVESLYAGFIWLAHHFGAAAAWVNTPAGSHLEGPLPAVALPVAKGIWVVLTLASVLLALRLDLARACLLALTAFVAFNFVLSPQYMIWLAPFVALVAIDKWDWPVGCLSIAILLAPLIYPTASYATGYDLPHVLVLCFRNVLLVAGWFGLLLSAISASRSTRSTGNF